MKRFLCILFYLFIGLIGILLAIAAFLLVGMAGNKKLMGSLVADFTGGRAHNITCEIPWDSRAGRCSFSISKGDFEKVKQEALLGVGKRVDWEAGDGCVELIGAADILLYNSDKVFLIFPGNTESSLGSVSYSESLGKACADVSFPYG